MEGRSSRMGTEDHSHERNRKDVPGRISQGRWDWRRMDVRRRSPAALYRFGYFWRGVPAWGDFTCGLAAVREE